MNKSFLHNFDKTSPHLSKDGNKPLVAEREPYSANNSQLVSKSKATSVFTASFLTKILLITLIGAIIAGILIFRNPQIFPIKEVAIRGTFQRVPQAYLVTILDPYMRKSFFAINTNALIKELLQNPWIHKVNIRRLWPNRIALEIKEQQAVAKWNNYALLNENGEIFRPKLEFISDDLPILMGSDEQAEKLWQYTQTMNDYLKRLNLSIKQAVLDPVSGWRLTLSNGIIIMLGSADFMDRFSNFVLAYPKIIKGKEGQILSVDLRYTNGLAVKWKNGAN